MRRHHYLGAIGALVGVASAGVIALLVMTGDPDEDERREPVRPTFALPEIPKTLPTPPKPSKVEAKPINTTPPTTKDDPAKARAAAIDQARKAGIIGKSALQQGGAFASLTGTGMDDSNIYGGLLGGEAGEMNGGFGYGRSGFGPGGGGTGWGTIGTGRYGTIGRGATGAGYGVGSTPSKLQMGQPNVTPATPTATDPGNLDKAIVRRYLRRNISRFAACQEKAPKATGTVNATFVVLDSGRVASANASGADPAIASCVAGIIQSIELPKPKGIGGVNVTASFTFKP